MRFLLPSAAVLLLSVVATDANLIISPPLTGKSGPERLLIIINGAFVANTHYQEIGQEIQKQSSDIQASCTTISTHDINFATSENNVVQGSDFR